MKRILCLVIAALFISSVALATGSTGSKPSKVEEVGTGADACRVITLVRYPENHADDVKLSTGDVVSWDLISDDGVTVNLISLTGSIDSVAGVIVGDIVTTDSTGNAEATIGEGNWGWMQTYGLNADANVQATMAVGQALCIDPDNARYAAPCPALNAGRRGGYVTMGFVYDAVAATATDVEVFLRLR